MSMVTSPSLAHTRLEDAVALLTGTLFVALGLLLLKAAGLGTGGTAGIAFLISTSTGLAFGLVFFIVNVPFFVFAFLAFGRAYLLKSIVATALLSAESLLLPSMIAIGHVEPMLAAVLGGLLVGMGLLALIRHRTGLGGFGVMAVWCQERFGWRAGKVQMAADSLVATAAIFVLPPAQVAYSVVGAVALNLVLALYHKPGRYMGV
ncbi:YitT family protein [Chthonobacter albigriseus]|uniref:YitT family protein n=1 Tax=Chthonobacter albigriseus TaxID=1683161 RepID=UPI0015EF132C|nr:YitT family protein [Chthonobacter albigriseus]